ncbi:hypothetical protein R0K30_02230 [Bacillus sp. SIMBA_154]|uniref:hypothetical protein n=1 Tax=Bacillus sp. SIMBA_154 TaxID=3080859 RepID=UPI003979A8DE
MIRILFTDGSERSNDPTLGWNLNNISEIQECFEEIGYYRLFTKDKGWEKIYKRDLKIIK